MSKIVKILHFSPHYENCGIAKYQEQYFDGMDDVADVRNEFFEYSPYQTRIMPLAELQQVMNALQTKLKDFDILHIQHEFGLFHGEEFAQLVMVAKAMGKKVIVSAHTAPDVAIRPLSVTSVGPRSQINKLRNIRYRRIFKRRHIAPMIQADLVLIHNSETVRSFTRFGVPKEKMQILAHPVPKTTSPPKSTMIAEKLGKKSGDVLFCTVGYMHKFKGVDAAIKALKFLPDNYKLAILGGVHKTSDEVKLYDKLADLIEMLNLRGRVYITGFVEDDSLLNAYIRECDIAVYPYDGVYYANVSSGSLNLAFANETPVVAYPTDTFQEMNEDFGHIVLTDTFAYYELARELQRIDLKKQKDLIEKYASKYAWPVMSKKLADIYKAIA